MKRIGPILIMLACALWLAGALWLIGYSGRVDLRDSQVQSCESGKVRQAQSGRSWRAQATADQIVADDKFQSELTRKARAAGAAQHRKTATLLEESAKLNCQKAIPKPGVPF